MDNNNRTEIDALVEHVGGGLVKLFFLALLGLVVFTAGFMAFRCIFGGVAAVVGVLSLFGIGR